MARYKVLSKKEEKLFESCPILSPVQRYRILTKLQEFPGVQKSTQSMSKDNKAHFFLTSAYYSYSGKFLFSERLLDDFSYYYRSLNNEKAPKNTSYDKSSFSRHKKVILKYFGHRPFNKITYKLAYWTSPRLVDTFLRLL